MSCNSSWKLKTRLQTILTGIYYQKQFSEFQILSQGKDWENLDRLVSTSPEELPGFSDTFDLNAVTLQWFITNFRCFPSYSPNFFRQVEVLHGLVFIASQKARLLARLLQRADRSLSYSTHLQLQRDAYLNSDSWSRDSASILWLLLQELALEEILLAEAGVHLSRWFDPMIQFLLGRIAGVYSQNQVSQQGFLDVRLPLPDFVSQVNSEQLNQKLQNWILPKLSEGKVVSVTLRASEDYLGRQKRSLQEQADIEMRKYGEETQREIDNIVSRLGESGPIEDVMNTEQFFLYEEESRRSRWKLEDALALCYESDKLALTDNDYEVLEVLKELAYCEAVAYSISYNNQCHMGLNSPFMLWNLLQAHEEVKHFHVIRSVLQHFGILTDNLTEKFLADSFELPGPEWFHNQYAVFTINFLGEVHNIRAYRLLAKSFDSVLFQRLMGMIIEDEVVHKKLFAAHYRYEANKSPEFSKNLCESILEEGLEMHQARISPHYKILMQKMGQYYASSGKTSALEFLNQSMKAQYLELKNLIPQEEFKISEFEFRRRHLRAYAF